MPTFRNTEIIRMLVSVKAKLSHRLLQTFEHTLGHLELVKVAASQERAPLVGAVKRTFTVQVEDGSLAIGQFLGLCFYDFLNR